METCLEYQDTTVTYGQLLHQVEKLTGQLCLNGIKKGSIVVFYQEKSIDFTVALLAVNKLDAVVMPVYAKTSMQSLEYIIKEYEANFIITTSEAYSDEMGESVQNSSVQKIFEVKNTKLNILKEQTTGKKESTKIHSECRFLLLSSGTTSLPKAIMLSNENVISNILSISAYLELRREDRIILYKNINHSSSLIGELLVGLYNGCYLYLNHTFLLGKYLVQAIKEKKITVFFTVPSILLDVFQEENKDYLEQIRLVNFYGDKFIENILQVIKQFEKITFIYSYGLTEASPRVSYIKSEDMLVKAGSSGRAIENVEIFIDCDEKKDLPVESGEILIKGPNVMLGYYKNEELTEIKLRDGYLHTGDMGYLDDEQYLYVIGRKDNMFIKNGKNIYPEEIEKAVYELFDAVDKVLVTHEEKNGCTEIICFITWKENGKVGLAEIYKKLSEKIDNYKIPDLIEYTDKIDTTANGKVIRSRK